MILLQWGSQGCSTRLVEMEQQRLLASAQSSTATCVLAVANTQSRKEQQALPFLDASLGLHLRNKREGEGPWVRDEETSFLPVSATHWLCVLGQDISPFLVSVPLDK